jgi:hypothetical protein
MMVTVIVISNPIAAGASGKSQFVSWLNVAQSVFTKYVSDYKKAEVAISTNNYVSMANICVDYQTLGGRLQSAPKTTDAPLHALTAAGANLLFSTGSTCLQLVASPTGSKASQLGKDFNSFATLESRMTARAKVVAERY